MKLINLLNDPLIYSSTKTFPKLLPNGYELVFGSLAFSIITNLCLVINVAKARKKYGIKPPTLYATSDDIDEKIGKCTSMDDVKKYK